MTTKPKTKAAKRPSPSAEQKYREEIDAAHGALDGVPGGLGRGHMLAERVIGAVSRVRRAEADRDALIAEVNATNAELRKAGIERDGQLLADRVAKLVSKAAGYDSIVNDLRDVQRLADERMRALDMIAGLVGSGWPLDVAHRAHDEITQLRAMRERFGDSETMIAVLAGALAAGGQTTAEEWVQIARAAARAARAA